MVSANDKMKMVAQTQQQSAEALVAHQKEDVDESMATLAKTQNQALRALERRIHQETKTLGERIESALDGMDHLSSHITTKQNELETQLSKVLKTVILVKTAFSA